MNELAELTAERDRYLAALDAIVNGDMHKGHVCYTCQIAREALDDQK